MIIEAHSKKFIYHIGADYVGDDWADHVVTLFTKVLVIGTKFMFRT